MARVAISPQQLAADILSTSTKMHFYWYMHGVVATEVLNKYLGHVTQSIYQQKKFYLKGRAKTGHKIEKCFIFALSHISHSESSVAVHLPHRVLLHLKQSLLVLF